MGAYSACSYSTIIPTVCFQMSRVLASARVRLKLDDDLDAKAEAEDHAHGTHTGDAEEPNVRLREQVETPLHSVMCRGGSCRFRAGGNVPCFNHL